MICAAAACLPSLMSFWSVFFCIFKYASTKDNFSTKGICCNSYPATERRQLISVPQKTKQLASAYSRSSLLSKGQTVSGLAGKQLGYHHHDNQAIILAMYICM